MGQEVSAAATQEESVAAPAHELSAEATRLMAELSGESVVPPPYSPGQSPTNDGHATAFESATARQLEQTRQLLVVLMEDHRTMWAILVEMQKDLKALYERLDREKAEKAKRKEAYNEYVKRHNNTIWGIIGLLFVFAFLVMALGG